MNTLFSSLKPLYVLLGLAPVLVSAQLPVYEPVKSLAGELRIDGSDTVGKVAQEWVKEFQLLYPEVKVELKQQGSGDGAKALLAQTAHIGSMSRKMKKKEQAAFKDIFGYAPTELRVGIDAVAVFSSKGLGIDQLTIAQVDQVFSSTLKCGGEELGSLSELGAKGTGASQMPGLFIRNKDSGTRGFFAKKALCKGEFRKGAQEFAHGDKLLASVAKTNTGFGFGGLADLTDQVQPIKIAKKAGGTSYEPNAENASTGKYPLSRYLYMYVNKAPTKSVDPVVREFIKYSVSANGQKILSDVGYVALPKRPADRTLRALR